MILNPKNGVDSLLFGMKQKDVIACLGNPDKVFKDEDGNEIILYNEKKLRLTFYEDENFRLGYIITSNPNCSLLDTMIIGNSITRVKEVLQFKNWEEEVFDSTTNYFNESNWLTFQVEFGVINKVELGATINDKDEFNFKFKQ